jgi:hypothetical protein
VTDFRFALNVRGKRLYLPQYWLDRLFDTSAFQKVIGSALVEMGYRDAKTLPEHMDVELSIAEGKADVAVVED